jgi:hypothetical protein
MNDSDGDMDVWLARMAAVTTGLAVVRDAIAALAGEAARDALPDRALVRATLWGMDFADPEVNRLTDRFMAEYEQLALIRAAKVPR